MDVGFQGRRYDVIMKEKYCNVPVLYREVSLIHSEGIHRVIGGGHGAIQQEVLDGERPPQANHLIIILIFLLEIYVWDVLLRRGFPDVSQLGCILSRDEALVPYH